MIQPEIEALLRKEFTAAFLKVWDTAIGIPLAANCDARPTAHGDRWISGVVWLGGDWTGSVTLALPRQLARKVTGIMLEMDPAEVQDNQYRDAVRELTNMSAGNLKSALPASSGLATPGCFEMEDLSELYDPFEKVVTLSYLCENAPIIAELHGLL